MKLDDEQLLEAFLPIVKVGSGDSSSRLASLPAFLASAVGAKINMQFFLSWSMSMENIMMRLNSVLKLEKLNYS